MRLFIISLLGLAAACKSAPDAASAPKAVVTESRPAPAPLRLADISVLGDNATNHIVVAAPPGSTAGRAPVYLYEAGAGPLATQFRSDPSRLRVPAELRATVMSQADGAFTAELVAKRHGLLIVSTEPGDEGGVTVKSGNDLTAAYTDAFQGGELQPLREADYAFEGDSPESGF